MSTIASRSCLSIRLLAVWLILLSTPTFAQLVCNGTPEGFDTGIPSGWAVTGGAAAWGDLTACGESENFTGGSGNAGCASSDAFGPGSFSTALRSPLFDLAGVTQASFRFALNFQSFAAADRLDFDLSADQGATWATLLSFSDDRGAFRAPVGEVVEVDLSAYVGQSGLMLRWHYHDPSEDAFDWYAQVDDAALRCDPIPSCGVGVPGRDRLADGSFEAGTPSAAWQEQSTQFPSPICTSTACGVAGAASGDAWAWFGGASGGSETSSLEQTAVLYPPAASLTFYLWMPHSSGNGQDHLRLLIDGSEVWRVVEGDVTYAGGYRQVELDLSAFADGASHLLRFEAATSGSPSHTNLFIDDLNLGGCPDVTALPEVAIADGTVIEGDAGNTQLALTVTLSHPWTQDVSVDYASVDGTATAGVDYQPVSAILHFPAGQTQAQILVPVQGDLLAEGDEAFSVVLTGAVNATLFDAQATATILDEDGQLTIADIVVSEGDYGSVNALFSVTLSPPSSRAVEVDFATAAAAGPGAVASAGVDYLATAGTLTFPPGTTQQTIPVKVLAERLDEFDEIFLMRLANPLAAKLLDAEAQATITDDDDAALSINDTTVIETDTESVQATFNVTLSTASDRTVTVDAATDDDTATAGADYLARAVTLSFPPGITEQTLAIEVLGDEFDEGDESFHVNLSSPSQAALDDPVGVGTIADNDTLEISVDDAPPVAEQDAGSVDSVFTLSLSLANQEPVTVEYTTADGTATAGVDYQPVSGTLSFDPGAGPQTVRVTLIDDGADEVDETFFLELSQPQSGSLGRARGVAIIIDDDGVLADAGGPYSGDEGVGVAFDASGSFHPNGTIVSYEWDLDADGVFDDATGVTASRAFPDNGTYAVAVRVTDDSGEVDTDSADVVVANLAPAVEAGPDQTLTEGDATILIATTFTDSGSGDTHTATIDWGDGTAVEAGVVDQTAGTVAGGHDYLDDGVFSVEVCVTDDDGGVACDSFVAVVENADPLVVENSRNLDLGTWTAEHRGEPANWLLYDSGRRVQQHYNADPSVFYGPETGTGVKFRGTARVATGSDDDFIGFVLGFQPGDWTNPAADFLLIDWRQADNESSQEGLSISRVTGSSPDLYGHRPSDSFQELARGNRFGTTGWADNTPYSFVFESDPSRVKVWVDGVLELDVQGTFDFGGGRFGFYVFSQPQAQFYNWSARGLGIVEGESTDLLLAFEDVGILDTHSATIDWQDGVVEPATVVEDGGSGTVTGSHLYPDDATLDVEVCVDDDDGGRGCTSVTLVVNNAAPEVDAGADRPVLFDTELSQLATFVDPGLLDTHTATVDWGDGTVETAVVEQMSGAGTVKGLHPYPQEGTYTVEICVTDDDGSTGCDSFEATWLAPRHDLAIDKTASLQAIRPGETVTYTLEVTNLGTVEPRDVVVSDALPSGLTFLQASSGGAYDAGSHSVTWILPVLAYQATSSLTIEGVPVGGLPFETVLTNTATVTDDGRFGPDVNPADNVSEATSRTWDDHTPRLTFGTLHGTEGVVAELSVPFEDTDPAETHTATVDWGDGSVEQAVVTGPPSAGTVTAGHLYADDVDGTVEVCVTDSSGHTGCFSIPLEIANDAPAVLRAGEPDLRTWTKNEYTFDQVPGVWVPAEDGRSVLQTQQSFPSFFFGDVEAQGNTIRARVVVEGTDDDFFGFALGYEPGDTSSSNADYLLISWKGRTQWWQVNLAEQGLAVGRVQGFVPFSERGEAFWLRWNTPHYQELARGATLGNARWFPHTEYDFVMTLTSDRLQISVNGSPEIDITGNFPAGRLAFYNLSQDDVRYSTFTVTSTSIVEGMTIDPIELEFRDLGLLDTHSAVVDWRDGTIESRPLSFAGGVGFVTLSHLYRDDGVYAAEICVEDDDGGLGCEISDIAVANVAPTVTAAADRTIPVAGATSLTLGSFTDPGLVDTHTASVDWGDGSPVEAGTVTQAAGSGTVDGQHAYAMPGVYTVEVCVTDDDGGTGCDALVLTVSATIPPEVSSISVPDSTEGDTVQLTASFTDLDPGDSFTATIDWGDGSPVEAGSVTPTASGGTVSGSHLYRDDLASSVEVCVTDSAGQTGCGSVPVSVHNFVPEVAADLDLSTWQFDFYTSGYATPQWQISADGTSVVQTQSSKPTIFYGDVPVLGRRVTGKVSVRTSSQQGFLGLALGYRGGDNANPNADFLLLDWRQRTETTSLIGMALWHITGPSTGLWAHNGADIEELARANNLGHSGWVDWREYDLTVELTATRARIWVDQVLEFDLTGDFADGFLGFYCYAQSQVRFRDFRLEGLALDEGEAAALEAEFFDAGPDDTHTATIDWRDGSQVEPATVTPGSFGGDVTASHVYGDDGAFPAQLCVTDDDLGTGCADFPILVRNVAPVVDAGPDAGASAGVAFDLAGASFTDPGTGDTHTATVDWGDGSPLEPASVLQGSGSGTVDAQHVYLAPGAYALEVCVTDDDGGAGCDTLQVDVTGGPPELTVSKVDVLAEDRDGDSRASPGDVVRYDLTIGNTGAGAASGVMLRDLIPAHTVIVPGSLTTTAGMLLSEDPVEVDLGELTAGASVAVSFEVEIDHPVPASTDRIVNQGTVTSDQLPAVLSDDPDLGGSADPTETLIAAAPDLVAEKSDTLSGDADGDGVPSPGDVLEYTVRVFNNGNTSATSVVFADPAPEHTTIVAGSVTSDRGTVDAEDPVTVTIGEIAGGMDVVTISFQVRVDSPIAAGVEEVSNQGLVASAELAGVLTDDPDVGGDADATLTAIEAEPKLTVEKVAVLFDDADADGVASPGDVLLYQLTAANDGNTAATAVVLSDPIPLHTTLEAGTVQTSQGTVVSEDPVEIDLGQVPVAGTATVSFQVRIDEPFPTGALAVSNQASASSAELADVTSDDPGAPGEADPTVTEVFITPEILAGDVTVTEGDPGDTVVAAFDVTLSEPSNRPVAVAYATADGSALAGADYQAAAGSLTLAAGDTSAQVTVALLGDLLDEADETFALVLSSAEGGTLADAEGVATVLDNDPPPQVSIGGVIVAEGDSGSVDAVFPLTLSAISGLDVTADYLTVDGTASAGLDYQAQAGSVLIPAGALGANVAVPVLGDLLDEPDETFSVQLSGAVHAILATAVADATILDDDEALLSIDDVSVAEGAAGEETQALFTVSLSTPSDRAVAVDFETTDGTATAGADYLATAGTLDFAPGETAHTVAVIVLGDDRLEPDGETFTVDLANPVRSAFADDQGQGTILDDEVCAGPNLLLNPDAEARPEGGDAAGGPPPGWIEVEGDAWQRRFTDPDPASGAAYFSPGTAPLAELEQDVDVSAYAARIAAGDQQFAFEGRVHTRDEVPLDVARIVVEYRDVTGTVVLEAYDSGEITSPFGWHQLADVRAAPAGTGWIRVRLLATAFTAGDNDGYFDALSLRSLRTSTLTIDDVTVYEGDSGTTDALFTVRLSCPYERDVTVSFATADGGGGLPPALVVADYLETLGTVTLPAGETEAEIAVPVVGDDVHEHHEGFTVTLSGPLADGQPDLGQAVLLDPEGVGTITNDDFCARSPGFWTTHVEDWPTDYLVIGGVEIDAQTLLDLLSYNGPDASNHLARQLIATQLNLLVGSDPNILPVVDDADAFLEVFPPGSDPQGADQQQADAIKNELDAYNNPDCVQTPVDPG